jgi:cyclopropane fatty-acyl-phospholipid synthase-like methyltransferase
MLRFIGNQFKKPTGFWGRIISAMMKKWNSRVYDLIIDELNIQPNDRILEIGYGPGLGVNKICSQFDCHVDGIDFSELMLKEASKRNAKHIKVQKANLILGDYLDHSYGNSTFDKVFCINVVYFWKDLNKPFSKIRLELKDNGLFSFFMAHQDDLNKMKFTKDDIFNKYTIEQVIAELEKTGFRDITFKQKGGYYVTCIK